MAYLNVKPSIVTKNGVDYNLQYDPQTGNAQIIAKNAPAGTKPIYQDGKWNASATELGFTESEKTQLHQQSILSVQSSFNSVGGVNSGAKLPQWASKNFTNGVPGQSSVKPQNSVSGNLVSTADGGLESLFGFVENPSESYKNFAVNGDKFGVGNEFELFGTSMLYPIDLMTSRQDHFAISQFKYKPSKADAIFGGTEAALQTLSTGLQTGSNLESIIGTVFLPMPNTIADSNNVNWGEDSMSNLSAAMAAQTMGDLKGNAAAAGVGGIVSSVIGAGFGKGAGATLLTKNLGELISKGAGGPELGMLLGTEGVSKLLKLQGMGVEPESILARGAGIVPNSNLELLFNSPVLRSFTFSYRLSPRSKEEAAVVRRIIRFFKQGMAVKKMRGKSGQASFFLGTPNVFKLEFRSGGSDSIDGVNKFKTCALKSFSCNYTPDGLWAAYEKGQPVSTTMQLMFDELEPIYDTDYQENNIFSGRDDLSSVSANSVGY